MCDATEYSKLYLIGETKRLFEEFEKLGGPMAMRPVTKYDTYRFVFYNKIQHIRNNWLSLAEQLLKFNISNDLKEILEYQAIQLDCEIVLDLLDPNSI